MASSQTGDIKLRIKSIESTMQITKAMELVATSKLRKAKQRVEDARPFGQILMKTIRVIRQRMADAGSVYTDGREIKKTCYVVFGGDRGLAGGYNVNVFKLWKTLSDGKPCSVLPIGKKALEFFSKSGEEIVSDAFSSVASIGTGDCYTIGRLLCRGYRNGDYDKVVLVFTDFVSMLVQTPESVAVLPFAPDETEEADDGGSAGFTLDGAPADILDYIVPQYVGGAVYSALCESVASEYGARRTAMDSANKNAGEIIDDLVLEFNRARQAVITQEITEIVSGAEAL